RPPSSGLPGRAGGAGGSLPVLRLLPRGTRPGSDSVCLSLLARSCRLAGAGLTNRSCGRWGPSRYTRLSGSPNPSAVEHARSDCLSGGGAIVRTIVVLWMLSAGLLYWLGEFNTYGDIRG